jgi:hypothetical protein
MLSLRPLLPTKSTPSARAELAARCIPGLSRQLGHRALRWVRALSGQAARRERERRVELHPSARLLLRRDPERDASSIHGANLALSSRIR